jgi:dihydroorotase (multifunctional complex type)
LTTDSLAEIVEALELIKPTGLRCVFHAEDQSLLDLYTARARQLDVSDYRRHALSRPELVEAVAVSELLTVAKALETPIHIAHVTSAVAVDLLRRAKEDGVPVSAETCPHYLWFTDEILEKVGPYGKINPPIRRERDRQALWEGIADGTIDLVATDHAPFTKEEKEAGWSDIIDAPPGHPGLEALVPLMLSHALSGHMDVAKAVALISTTPARLFDLYPRKGALLPGSDADVTVYDPRRKTTMRRGSGFSRAADCDVLYDGMELQGGVHLTIVNGKVVYRDGEVTGQPGDGRVVSSTRRAMVGSHDARP